MKGLSGMTSQMAWRRFLAVAVVAVSAGTIRAYNIIRAFENTQMIRFIGIVDIIVNLPEDAAQSQQRRVDALLETYEALSATYQLSKGGADIPLP